MQAVRDALSRTAIGAPVRCRNLTMIPLVSADERSAEYLTFGDARRRGVASITETSEHGTVPELRFVNAGDARVLLLDGEELVGAKQNRIVNLTILVPKRRTIAIPVSCVEAGRWSHQSREFTESSRAMFREARARKLGDVTASLAREGQRHTDQGAVWRDVGEKSARMAVHSPTSAMSEIFERNRDTVERYVAELAPTERQVGALFAIGGRIAGIELFDAPATFASYLPTLVRSYALDAMELDDSHVAPLDPAMVARALDELLGAGGRRYPAVGVGEDLRFGGTRVQGAALVDGVSLVHLTAFWKLDGGDFNPDTNRSRATFESLSRDGVTDARPGAWLSEMPPALPTDGSTWDRVEGMLLGLAIGDALGNTSEGMTPADRRQRYGEIRDYLPNDYVGGRRVGLPSDDSQLAFRTLEHLLDDGALYPERLAGRLARGPIFGIGRTVHSFLRAIQHGVPWQRAAQRSAGNGALMRIAPVLVPHVGAPSPALWADAALAGMVTHNDPASIGACVGLVRALWGALGSRGQLPMGWWLTTICGAMREIEGDATRYRSRTPHLPYEGPMWRYVEQNVRVALGRDLPTQVACDMWWSGAYLMETLPSVIYILERHASDPCTAMVRAVNDAWDNDTVAAIVGAAVGALHGRAAFPRRWVERLLGRTAADDDGRVFDLLARARSTWGEGSTRGV